MINERRPLAPRMVPQAVFGETVVSYASRVEALLEAPHRLLTNKARSELRAQGHKSFTVEQLIAQLATLLEGLCQLPHNTFDRGVWGMELGWHSCPGCGPIVQVIPSVGRYVCHDHLRWTGPAAPDEPDRWAPQAPAANHGIPVEPSVATAVRIIEDLRATAPRLADECIYRALSVYVRGSLSKMQPGDFVLAACLAVTTQSLDTLTRVAHAQNAETGHDAVRGSVMQTVLAYGLDWDDDMVVAAADQAWMALRPTAVQARIMSGRQRPLDNFTPCIDVPSHLSEAPWCGDPAQWLTAIRTTHRTDEQWWGDRYVLEGPGGWILMCPAGHVLHQHPCKARDGSFQSFHCVVCEGTRAVAGFTSLADTDPDLATQWHPQLNGDREPTDCLRGSSTNIWWLCPAGHDYLATIANRAINGSACPYCSRHAVRKGLNDLATTHPYLAVLWDPEADNPPADSLSAGNGTTKIRLRCPRGHVFVRVPRKIISSNGSCPICVRHGLSGDVQDLATTHPAVAAWWHPDRNGPLTPSDVTANSGRKVWWRCPDGHDFEARIQNRTQRQAVLCPVDTGRFLLPGTNDLATKHPDLVRDWDYRKNGLSPGETVPGNTEWYWTCFAGHTQRALTHNRKQSGGCTLCPPEHRVAKPVRRFNRGRQGWDKRARS